MNNIVLCKAEHYTVISIILENANNLNVCHSQLNTFKNKYLAGALEEGTKVVIFKTLSVKCAS